MEEEVYALIQSLDRMCQPVLQHGQRVVASEKQEQLFSANRLARDIRRLARYRLEGQRAKEPQFLQDLAKLERALDRLDASVTPAMQAQRIQMTPEDQRRRVGMAQLGALVDRLTRSDRRCPGQEWLSLREQREREMEEWEDRLDALNHQGYADQRYHLTGAKERQLWVDRLMGKVCKGRYVSQDASFSLSSPPPSPGYRMEEEN